MGRKGALPIELYSTDNPQLSPEDIFDHQVNTSHDPETELERVAEVVANVRGVRARLRHRLEGNDLCRK